MRVCGKCGSEKSLDDFYVIFKRGEHQHMHWCKKCLNKNSADRQRATKERAVILMGGKCTHCGYSKCMRALEFHHTDPENKHHARSSYGASRTWGWKRYWEEISKCILLCANCHREEEERISEGC
jgi:hypothetical protein